MLKIFGNIKRFLVDVKVELTKVSWPTRQELIGATWVVIAVTLIMAVYIGCVDLSFSKLLTFLIR